MTTRPTSFRLTSAGTRSVADPKTGTQALLETLTRLNDKSTQRMAADELEGIVQRLDAEGVTTFISNICSARTWDPKPFARKECARVVGLLMSEACPVHELVLQQHLGKLLAYLRKAMQDMDAAVRDAACSALVAIAASLTAQAGSRLPGTLATPLIKLIFDCFGEQRKETQSAAGQALLQVSPYLSNLDPELVKVLLRLLRSPTFQGTPSLLSALACSEPESHRPLGLCKECASSFLPVLPRLIGQCSPSPSGILGCLDNKDWAVRRAAGDALRALALLLGPYFERGSCWDINDPECLTGWCLQALEKARFDKVKEARDAAREASGVLQDLVAYMQQGGDPHSWGDYSSVRCTSPSGTISPGMSSPAARVLDRHASVAERFQRAAAVGDVIAEFPSSPNAAAAAPKADEEQQNRRSSSSSSISVTMEAVTPAEQPVQLGEQVLNSIKRRSSAANSVGGSEADEQQQLIKAHYIPPEPAIDAQPSLDQEQVTANPSSKSAPSSRRTTGGGVDAQKQENQSGVIQVGEVEWQQLQSEVAALRSQHAEHSALISQLSERFSSTVAGLQAQLQDVQQQLAACQQQQKQSPTQPQPVVVPDSPAYLTPISRLSRPGATSSIATPGADSAAGSVLMSQLAAAGLSQSEDYGQAATRRGSWLDLQGHQQGLASSMGSLTREQMLGGTPSTGGGLTPGGSPCVDLQAAYAAALSGSRGHMHLLRLIQRTGPVWEQLQPDTAQQLLQIFIQNVQEGVMLHRVLPWLWRLADEDAKHRVQVPPAEQQQVVAALEACPAAEDVQVQDKVSLLTKTLKAVWGLSP